MKIMRIKGSIMFGFIVNIKYTNFDKYSVFFSVLFDKWQVLFFFNKRGSKSSKREATILLYDE